MVGLYVCWSVDWNYEWPMVAWLADWFVRYLVCRSIDQTSWPVCYPTSHRLTGHRLTGYLNIHPPALDQPTKDSKDTSSIHAVGAWISVIGVQRTPDSVRPVGCGRAAWPMPANHWSCLRSVPSILYGGYIPPRPDGHYPNRLIWEHSLGVCDLVGMSFIRSTYKPILMLNTAYIAPQTPYA